MPWFSALIPALDESFQEGEWVLTVTRDLFSCAGCGTEVERFASGYLDTSSGWHHQWQPRIVDADGRAFCSEMCGHRHAGAQG